MSPEAFWEWFSAEAGRLRTARADEVAERVGEQLHRVDAQLGVEVEEAQGGEAQGGEAQGGARELVLTAEGRSSLFPAVRALVAKAPPLEGWRVRALRPPRGFDFTLEEAEVRLDARALAFLPLDGFGAPRHLGVRVFVPDALAEDEDIEEVVWRLVQRGLGEEAASHLEHLEVAPASSDTRPEPQPLSALSAYVAQHRAARGKPGG